MFSEMGHVDAIIRVGIIRGGNYCFCGENLGNLLSKVFDSFLLIVQVELWNAPTLGYLIQQKLTIREGTIIGGKEE